MNKYKFLVREYARTKLEWESIKVARNVDRAKGRKVPATLTDLEWLQILYVFNFKCAFPGCDGKAETMEHLVPLRKGGGTDRLNVVPACAKCNNENDKALQRIERAKKMLKGIDWAGDCSD